ncbi:MAG TPA: hypothetical protein VG759_29005 [Candidatus Angelobacter sp.]|nr:hypothetical protein [Candidatus Angelobacter sp.]
MLEEIAYLDPDLTQVCCTYLGRSKVRSVLRVLVNPCFLSLVGFVVLMVIGVNWRL